MDDSTVIGGPSSLHCSLPFFNRPFNFASGLAGPDGFSAVVLLLALGQPKFDFSLTALGEIDAERNECEALLLCLAEQLVDFFLMQEQLAHPDRVMIHDVAVTVRTDVAVMEKDLALFYARVTILQIHPTITKGLHLRAFEDDTGFKLLLNKIVVVGFPVGGHDLILLFRLFRHELPGKPTP
jgi:hypothetical protein